jgi:hypothetical protein
MFNDRAKRALPVPQTESFVIHESAAESLARSRVRQL